MTDDDKALVARLRWSASGKVGAEQARLERNAADRIEAQAAEIERLKAEVKNAWCDDALPCRQLMDAKQEIEWLREALTQIARMRTDLRGDFSLGSHQSDIARAALAGKAEQ